MRPMRNRTLTVCTSTLNAAPFVGRWYDSLRALAPEEVLVVDSLSTDGTPEMLRALGCRVISERCDLGTGRNVAVREARGEVVLMTDADNEFLRPAECLWCDADRFGITIDPVERAVWSICGSRELFLVHPFERVVKWGVTREDYAFFARSPARIRSVPGLGNDLKRGPAARGPIMWMKNGGWFRGGLTAGDVLRLSGRLYRAGDRRYAADLLSVLGAHLLTLGHSELQGEKGDRTGGGP